jgi:hypothetical protein
MLITSRFGYIRVYMNAFSYNLGVGFWIGVYFSSINYHIVLNYRICAFFPIEYRDDKI